MSEANKLEVGPAFLPPVFPDPTKSPSGMRRHYLKAAAKAARHTANEDDGPGGSRTRIYPYSDNTDRGTVDALEAFLKTYGYTYFRHADGVFDVFSPAPENDFHPVTAAPPAADAPPAAVAYTASAHSAAFGPAVSALVLAGIDPATVYVQGPGPDHTFRTTAGSPADAVLSAVGALTRKAPKEYLVMVDVDGSRPEFKSASPCGLGHRIVRVQADDPKGAVFAAMESLRDTFDDDDQETIDAADFDLEDVKELTYDVAVYAPADPTTPIYNVNDD